MAMSGHFATFDCVFTWTADTALAFVAVSSLALTDKELPTINLDFLTEYETLTST